MGRASMASRRFACHSMASCTPASDPVIHESPSALWAPPFKSQRGKASYFMRKTSIGQAVGNLTPRSSRAGWVYRWWLPCIARSGCCARANR